MNGEKSVLRNQPANLRQAEAAPPENLPIHSLLGIEERSRADRKQNALHETRIYLRNCGKLRTRLLIICLPRFQPSALALTAEPGPRAVLGPAAILPRRGPDRAPVLPIPRISADDGHAAPGTRPHARTRGWARRCSQARSLPGNRRMSAPSM